MIDASRPPPRGSPRNAGATTIVALLCAAVLLCGSCGGGAESVEAVREQLLDAAATHVEGELSAGLSRARRALARMPTTLSSAGRSRSAQFDALERTRVEEGVDGLSWEDAGGSDVWSGEPVNPKDLPGAPRPWESSFASGDTTYHAGPFLRALVVTTVGTGGGTARATVILKDRGEAPVNTTVERRWATRFRVRGVRVLPPEALAQPTGAAVRRLPVPARASGLPATLAVEVEAPDEDRLREELRDRRLRRQGFERLGLGLLAVAAATVALRRRVRPGFPRDLGIAGLLLLARHALVLLEPHRRFREIEPAFRSLDFGVTGWGGWLASPGDAVLSAAALLVAAAIATRSFATAPPRPRRLLGRLLGLVGLPVGALGVVVWLTLVEAATIHSQLDFFGPGSLVPSLPRGLLLLALCAGAANAWILARAGIRLALSAFPRLPAIPVLLLAAGILGALAALRIPEGFPAWIAFLVPATAALLGRLRPGAARPGAPSRVLLLSVLSSVILFPALWTGTAIATRADVKAQLVELVSREDSVQARAGTWFARLGEDTYLADAITRWNEEGGQFPKGLALYAWLRMGFNPTSEDDVMVVVWSAAGTFLDRFALNTPPPGRLPRGAPDPRAEEDSTIEVEGGRDNALRSVVGRQRVRSTDGKLLGTVTVIVPDAMAVELEGLTPRIAARPSEEGRRGGRAHALWLSLVSDGRVVASDDPEARWFEPPTLPSASELSDPVWLEPSEASGGRPWAAVSAGDRGILVARLADAGADRLLFALARVLVVGAGAGTILALIVLAFGLRGWRPRLQDKILGSYFLISVLPLLFLGYANWRDALARNEEQFRRRQETLVRAARADLQAQPPDLRNFASLPTYGQVYSADFSLYVNGEMRATSLRGLVDAELLPARLPASVFQATELDGRAFAVRDETFAGRTVRVGYAPILDAPGRPWGTVSVPLIYDSESAEQQAAETGSVLLAAYLLTLVLVVVIGMYTSRSLAKPLDDLAEGTKRVAAGELDLAIPGRRGDELGTLVNAFNSMTGELRSARDRAAKAEREAAWRGMARQVAHEIKNPLTPMKLMLQQLQATAKTDPAFAREMLEPTTRVLLEQIDALSRIASDFAAFARFPPRTLRPCDLNDVLRSVVALYGTEQHEATVTADLADGLPPVRWDQDELRRVFLNLVANAVQALDPAKGRVRVEVRSRPANVPGTARPGILVTISDDGVGIPPENRARLFEPDFSTKSSGTGLGLAICRRILVDLGGEIRIDSDTGTGTTVSAWFPSASPEGPDAPAGAG